MAFVFGTWPPVDDSGGGGSQENRTYALVQDDGALLNWTLAGSISAFTPGVLHPSTGVYTFALTAEGQQALATAALHVLATALANTAVGGYFINVDFSDPATMRVTIRDAANAVVDAPFWIVATIQPAV